MTNNIAIRNCRSLEDFHRCIELQREVWGEEDLEIEPASLFVVAAHTGGQVIGAFVGDRMVGYTLAVAGVKDGDAYLHSHMTGVRAEYRNRGVGRMLKLFQREEALSRGLKLILWTFDPLELRNAHFNLNRLGAICRKYLPNLYGVTTSPLHRSLPTDRLLAEWHLDSPRVVDAVHGKWPNDGTAGPALELPSDLQVWQQQGDSRIAEVQDGLRERFLHWFEAGYAAVGISIEQQNAAYLLSPWTA